MNRSTRIGRDEFVIPLPETDSISASVSINIIRDSLKWLMNTE